MVLEDIPGHKEHYHLLAKDDRSYHIRADINSVNIRVVRKTSQYSPLDPSDHINLYCGTPNSYNDL